MKSGVLPVLGLFVPLVSCSWHSSNLPSSLEASEGVRNHQPSLLWQKSTQDGKGSLSVYSDRSYKVHVGGKTWLEGSPVAVHVSSVWFCDEEDASKRSECYQLQFDGSKESKGVHDTLGEYDEFVLSYSMGKNKVPFSVAFQHFPEADLFLFEQRFPKGLAGVHFKDWDGKQKLTSTNAQHHEFLVATGQKDTFTVKWPDINQFQSNGKVSVQFPCWKAGAELPGDSRHLTWVGRFAVTRWGEGFGGAGGQEGGPVVLFDGKARDSIVMSNFDNFKTSILGYDCFGVKKGENAICAGPHAHIKQLPAGFKTSTSLSFSWAGPTDAMYQFGSSLQKAHSTNRMKDDKDILTTKLSYWTDNGGYYAWYKYDDILQEGTPADVLQKLSQEFVQNDIRVHYYQLDAYWFDFERANSNCKKNVQEQSVLFPEGLAGLSESIKGKLLLYDGPTCASFVPDGLPEEDKAEISLIYSNPYNLSWAEGQMAQVSPQSSEKFFSSLMATFKQKGAAGYEIDFMDFNFLLFKDFQTQVGASHAWLAAMNRGAVANDLPIQYCMPLPSDILESVLHNAVTNVRASHDYQVGTDNWNIGPTSLLHGALGLKSSKDNFQTAVKNGAINAKLNALVATLSTGPVGFSDELGTAQYDIIRRTSSKDGTLIRPSRCPHPIDRSYLSSDSSPSGHVWTTFSKIGENLWYQILAVETSEPAESVRMAELYPVPEESTTFIVWELDNPKCAAGMAIKDCAKQFSDTKAANIFTGNSEEGKPLNFKSWVASPIIGGYALLGEISKFVPVSPDRIVSLVHADGGGMDVQVRGSAGEIVEMLFVLPTSKLLQSEKCTVGEDGMCVIAVTPAQTIGMKRFPSIARRTPRPAFVSIRSVPFCLNSDRRISKDRIGGIIFWFLTKIGMFEYC